MLKFKKLFVASLAATAMLFTASICASAAQIDSLSMVNDTVHAHVDAENARLYVAECNGEGLLSDVFFADIGADGEVTLPISKASEYSLYLWDKDSLAPICSSYKLINGRAFAEGSETPVPQYKDLTYSFNQDDDVMIVSAINETEIRGFKAGVETVYPLTEAVTVLGLSDNFADVIPGSVVLIGTNRLGQCSAVELLASLGIPINPEAYIEDFGVYDASDGSTRYKNIVSKMFGKSGTKMTLEKFGGPLYHFINGNVQCYRVGIAMDGDTPIITYTSNAISATGDRSVFLHTAYYHHYVYLRFDTESPKKLSDGTYTEGTVTQCVFYAVPTNFDPTQGDDEYTGIFSLEPKVIIP